MNRIYLSCASLLLCACAWGGGLAIDFNDNGGDYINAGSGASLDDLGPVTYACWIKPEAITGTAGYLFAKFPPSGSTGFIIFIVFDNASDNLGFVKEGTPDLTKYSANNVLTVGSWQHVAMTWDGGTAHSGVHLYVNGSEVSYGTVANGASLNSDASHDQYFANRGTTGRPYDGDMAQPLIWNRVLSAEEIATIYATGGRTVPRDSLVLDLDNPAGKATGDTLSGTCPDRSGEGNNGTISGDPTAAATIVRKRGAKHQ